MLTDRIVPVASLLLAAPLAAQDCSLNESFTLTAHPISFMAHVGSEVDVSGDLLIGGAPYEDHAGLNSSGAAYLFEHSGAGWSELARFTAGVPGASDRFGHGVAVSGDTVAIGATGPGTGQVSLYRRAGATWSLEAELGPYDWDLDLEGDRLVVLGGVGFIVFERTGTSWAPTGSAAFPYSGDEIALSGDTVLVGAGNANRALVFELDGGAWVEQAELVGPGGSGFGEAVALDADTALVGAVDEGAAYFFERAGSSWGPGLRVDGTKTNSGDSFGYAVAVHGDTGFVSARNDDVPYNGGGGGLSFQAGSVFRFERSGGTWLEDSRLHATVAFNLDNLGQAVAYDGGWLAVGSWGGDQGSGGGWDSGEVNVFDPSIPCVLRYCTAGTSASGCQATLTALGIPSASAPSGFDILAEGVEGQKDGLFFYGTGGQVANSWGNSSSFKCVPLPVRRSNLKVGNGAPGTCSGFFRFDVNKQFTSVPAHNPGVGAVMQLQLWYRDPQNTSNQSTSLSDAVEFTVQP